MLVNEQLAAQELMHRLVSLEYADQDYDRIISEYRQGLADQRADHTAHMVELASQAVYKFARVERGERYVESINKFVATDSVVELIEVKQSEIDAFCQANGLKKAELLEALNSQRKEAVSKDGKRYQHYPLLFNEESETENRLALEAWKQEVEADQVYMANKAANKAKAVKPLAGPVHTIFGGLK